MSRSFTVVLAACFLTVAALPLQAEWLANGTTVTWRSDVSTDPRIAHDGAGNVFVTWSQQGFMDEDIYIQKIYADGSVPWGDMGRELCGEEDVQQFPRIVADGFGGAIIAWEDYRNGLADIYAQRIGSNGYGKWASYGVAVCTATGYQLEPYIVSDGEGGAVIVWEDYRTASHYDIYAQRIDSLGNTMWAAGGVALCTAAEHQLYCKVASDGSGGAIAAWTDYRSGDGDVYAQRINREGAVQWMANGAAVCAVAAFQSDVQVAPDGAGGALFVWQDYRNGNADIYAQRINGSGAMQWTSNGASVCTEGHNQQYPYVASDGAGGAIVVWHDGRNTPHYDIYAQRMDAGGSRQWSMDGVGICTKSGDQSQIWIVSDGAGGAVITWKDSRVADGDVYAQRVNGDGVTQWQSDGVVLCTEYYCMFPRITSVGGDTTVVVWRDNRGDDYDFYAQKINGDGRVTFLTPGIDAIEDVRDDQGSWVRIHVEAPGNDSDEVPRYPTTCYNVWRRIEGAMQFTGERGLRVLTGTDTESLVRSILDPSRSEEVILAREQASMLGLPPGNWESVGIHPAIQEPYYYFLVPTHNDSTSSGIPWEQYVVTAHTIEPRLYFVSDPDSGYSVDNLAPDQPQGFAGIQSLAPQGLRLSWLPNTEGDLSHYGIYRGDDESFVPDETSLIGTTTDTVLIDTEWIPTDYYFYKLAAVDVHDNAGVTALLRPEDIKVGTLLQAFAAFYDGSAVVVTWTLAEGSEHMKFFVSRAALGSEVFMELAGATIERDRLTFHLRDTECEPGETYHYQVSVEDEEGRRVLFETEGISIPAMPLTLYQNHPNPFNPSTTIRYYLPERIHVTLEIYDIAGRRISRLVDGVRERGFQNVEWNGTDGNGNEVVSGVYIYRLRAGKDTISRKMILVR